MIIISSLQNENVKHWCKLKQKKYRDQKNMFLVEDEHLVQEAIKNDCVLEIITSESKEFAYKTYFVTKEILKKISEQETPPKIIAVCQKLTERDIEGPAIFLDGLQDPGNLGTIIRSALAFDIPNIILNENTVDLYNPKVIRSTEGMLFAVNVVRKNTSECLEFLKQKNYQIIGTDVQDGIDIENLELSGNVVFVIGSEGKGITKSRDYCDAFIKIPMNKSCESLNASVSASIIMYEYQRRSSK